MLRDFIALHRAEILASARSRVAKRSSPVVSEVELTEGLPIFLDQLDEALGMAVTTDDPDHADIRESADRHGYDLFHQGLSVGQVVHDYGDLCQVITALAVSKRAPIATEEFQTLNLCLDDAIAGAVTSFDRLRERAINDEGTERLGVLAHEMRNLLNTAMMSFSSIKKGIVAAGGSTSVVHERTLLRLQMLIDRSLADVRLDAQLLNLERLSAREIIDDVEIGAATMAATRGLKLNVTVADPTAVVVADRQILAAAIANLLQNALKFTHAGSTVELRAIATEGRVLIEVEDECGGLPPEKTRNILRPFTQQGRDRTGLGLGLSICAKAAKSVGGELRLRDLPGKGCVFTIDIPRAAPVPT